jgi:hypothetical protein
MLPMLVDRLVNKYPPSAPKAYYDGDDIDGAHNTTLTAGVSTIATWKNKGSLTGGDATQATAGKRPLFQIVNGHGVCRVDGVDDFLQSGTWSSPLTQPTMVAIVAMNSTAGATQNLVIDGLSAHRIAIGDHLGALQLNAGGSFTAGNSAEVHQKYNLQIITFNGASTSADIDWCGILGLAGTDVGSQTCTGITIGADNAGGENYVGDIAAVVVWSGTLPSVQAVRDWASAKYGIGWPRANLVGHRVGSYGTWPILPIVGGDKIALLGDSLTGNWSWYLAAGGLRDQINARVTTPCTFVNNGHVGDRIIELNARVNADIVGQSPQPTVVLIQDGANETGAGNFDSQSTNGGPTDVDTFLTNSRQCIDRIRAIPSVRIGWVGPLCKGENYPDPTNAQYNWVIRLIQQVCAEKGITYFDVRAAQQEYERINNGPPPGAATGVLTNDGTHTGIGPGANPLGAVLMANQCIAGMSFSG